MIAAAALRAVVDVVTCGVTHQRGEFRGILVFRLDRFGVKTEAVMLDNILRGNLFRERVLLPDI